MRHSQPYNREQAWNYSLRLLNQRGYSEQNLIKKLREHQVSEEDCRLIVKKLKELRFLDDRAYAENLYRSQARNQRLSKRAIAFKLQQKGIDRATIDQTLQITDDVPSETERARSIAEKYYAKMQNLPEQKQRTRLLGYLHRRGFPPGLITTITREIMNERSVE